MSDSLSSSSSLEQQARDLRFKQMMSYGVGAAIVFGLVGALSSNFLGAVFGPAAVTGAAAWIPIVGLAVIAAAGICAISYSANTLVKANALDQETQAEKNAEALRAKARAHSMAVEGPEGSTRVTSFPEQAAGMPLLEAEQNASEARRWADTVRPNRPQAEQGNWQERASAKDDGVAALRA